MQLRKRQWMGLCALLGVSLSATAHAQENPEIVPGEILVGLKASKAPRMLRTLASEVGQQVGFQSELNALQVRLNPGVSLRQAMNRLLQRDDVAYVEPNLRYRACVAPNDPRYSGQYALRLIQAESAWDLWRPQAQVILAIVDTGVDYLHPDLKNKMLRNSQGAVIGYNVVGANNRSSNAADPLDDQGHGTHCAGIAAAETDNALGVSSVAGGSATANTAAFVKIMPVKSLDHQGAGTSTTVARGITWAADNGAKVISLSLGGGSSQTLANAVQYAINKGCVVVGAAGNEASTTKSYPGAYPNVLCVAATDGADKLASFSNYGDWVTCAAPGVGIASTVLNGAYANYSGTSMATPLVAGIAAMLLSHKPTLTNSDVRTLIQGNVDAYTPYSGRNIASGAGRVNAFKALQAAIGVVAQPPPAPVGVQVAAGSRRVRLNWTANIGQVTYTVKRGAAQSGPFTAIARQLTTNAYTDTGLTNGRTYYYVVSATNGTGESENSRIVAATPQAQQLLGNPGFENGVVITPWAATTGVITNAAGISARNGSWKAQLGGMGRRSQRALAQAVAIPAEATTARLTFWLQITTQETANQANDAMRVKILNASGRTLATLATYSNLNRANGFTQRSFDLSAYRGQTVILWLEAEENASLTTRFVADDFALMAE